MKINVNGKLKDLVIIDAESGLDWTEDLVGYATDLVKHYDDDGNLIMSQEDYDWWKEFCSALETAEVAIANLRKVAKNKEAFNREYEQSIEGTEFNEIPAMMMEFVELQKGENDGKN